MALLRGKTIAITEARRATELVTLIAKLGGVPYSAPAVREVPRSDRGPALDAIARIIRGEVGMVVFLTGVGTRALLDLASETGTRVPLITALATTTVVARGPKPVAVLRAAGVRIDVMPEVPTSEGLLTALIARDLHGTVVAVQLYGDEVPFLVDGLRERGATVLEIPLYEWALPEDQEPLRRLIHDLVDGRVDVLAFTSSPQINHLLAVAERLGVRDRLLAALREPVLVAAIGPVCEVTLRAYGIPSRIQPHKGTMGALVHSIADYFAREEKTHGR